MKRSAPPTSAARAEILAAALETYRAVGPRAFTMGAAARRAGLTTPALYRHFDGKDALLRELVTQGFELFSMYLARGLGGSTPFERLWSTGGAYFDFAVDHPGHYETLFLTASIPGLRRFPKDFEQGRSATFQLLVDRVRECVDAGVLKKGDPSAIALSMWVHVHGFMSLHLMGRFGGSRAAARTLFDASLKRLLEGLEAR
jgi:AcrR family transcriptional regulator